MVQKYTIQITAENGHCGGNGKLCAYCWSVSLASGIFSTWRCKLFGRELAGNAMALEQSGDCKILIERHLATPESEG